MVLHGFRRYVVALCEMVAFGIYPHSNEPAYNESPSVGPCFVIIIARNLEL